MPGVCACSEGFAGQRCDDHLAADGTALRLLPGHHVAVVSIVWGITPTVERAVDGAPLRASLDAAAPPLLSPEMQTHVASLCEYLEAAPPSRVRPGSLECPLRTLQVQRQAAGLPFPMPEADVLAALAALPGAAELIGVNTSLEVLWLEVRAATNVLVEGNPAVLREAADWWEGLAAAHAAHGGGSAALAVGWPTSQGFAWMEALHEAVYGTIANLLSGALLTGATLLLLTGSLSLALATMASVCAVLIAFAGYLVRRGYLVGIVEAISISIFIGFA